MYFDKGNHFSMVLGVEEEAKSTVPEQHRDRLISFKKANNIIIMYNTSLCSRKFKGCVEKHLCSFKFNDM